MTHEIPVDSKSETRLLVIFSLRALATTAIGVIFGLLIGAFFMKVYAASLMVGAIIFGVIGFIVGTFKIPEIKRIPITKEIAGMYSYEAIFEYWKFKRRRKMYVYSKAKSVDESEEI